MSYFVDDKSSEAKVGQHFNQKQDLSNNFKLVFLFPLRLP